MALRIALFGQAAFGRDCLDRLREEGHRIVGVWAPPAGRRPDPLAARAEEFGIPVERRRYFRKKSGEAIREAVESYRKLDPELNVLAYVTAFLPREIVDAPPHKSICFHPSLLPRYRGGAAVNWQIILGERESGVTVFVPDEGVDTGPILVQRGGVEVGAGDTTGSLYFDKLYPLGVDAVVEAVRLIDSGRARPVPQDESKASFQALVDDTVAAVDLGQPAEVVDRLVRGCDPQPGALVRFRGAPLRLYDARLEADGGGPPGTVARIDAEGLRVALRGGCLRVGRVRADREKETAAAFAERAGLQQGDRLESA
jgi:methionyl-tRNA formyltransferase